MRLLLTNDDGINAPGLTCLEQIAQDLVGPQGDIWVVAPATEQSGVGHCINYTKPTLLTKLGDRRFAVEGAPADCVLAGLHDVMKGNPPDLILSGVNRGNNAGENTLYSGTIGAAIEAALQDVPAIALSQFYGPKNVHLDNTFEAALTHGAEVVRRIIASGLEGNGPYRTFWNVNFPPIPAAEVRGMQAVAQGRRPTSRFGAEPATSPSGRRYLWIKGGRQDEASAPGTDVAANLDGYISVTPMRADLTARDQLASLGAALA